MAQPDALIPGKLLKVRRLEADDIARYRELRLEALQDHPEAFSASWEDESAKPASWWAERMATNTILGGWVDDSPLLVTAALHVQGAAKRAHKSVLWGMYVRPEARGTGLSRALVREIIEQAKPLVEEICLTVVASNAAAHQLYSAAGFERYGLERRAIRVGDDYFDDVLMALPLQRP